MRTTGKIAGVNISDIAAKTGTPVIIYDEDMMRNQIRTYTGNFRSEMFDIRVVYASKAFLCGAMVEIIKEEGMYADVVSGGEMHCAVTSGLDPSRIYFHGNNKSAREISEAFEYGIGQIVADNISEIEDIAAAAEKFQKPMRILLRINPGIEAHTHEYITTARKDSKFGVSIDNEDIVRRIWERVQQCEYLEFAGFHAHIGSQIFSREAFVSEIDTMVDYTAHMQQEYGITVQELDFGGGFAVVYTDADEPIPVEEVCPLIISECEKKVIQRRLNLKTISIEPGRSIVGEAGYSVYTAGYSKTAEDKNYIFVDGGMADNIRPALYGAEYSCENISKPDAPMTGNYVIAGKCCESGDILIKNTQLPKTDAGDLIVINTTGAYGYSMASNYNRLGRPPVVFASEGRARCVIRREEYTDMEKLESNEQII